MPLTVSQNIVDGDDGLRISVSITALEDIYFNYSQQVATDFRHNDCYSICRGSGIGVICVRPRKPLHFILQTVGL